MRLNRRPIKAGALLAGAALALGIHAAAAQDGGQDSAQQKRIAESKRAALRQKLQELKQSIDRTTSAKSDAADALAASETAISDAERRLHDLAARQKDANGRLQALSRQQAALRQTVDAQQKQLAQLLRDQYMAGNEDRLKLLLSGDDPNRINRELQYMGYVSRAQAALIDKLRANLQEIEANQARLEAQKKQLDDIADEARSQHAVLEQQKAQRATLLAQLSNKLAAQRQQAGKMERDEHRLSSLVDKLSALIEAQRKAQAEQRRREQAARAAHARRLAEAKRRGEPASAADTEEQQAPPALARNDLLPDSGMPAGAFAALRGKLHLPIRGELTSRFGSRQGDGPSSKGLFIRAPAGTEVHAIAGGRVVFADWLRGFGNLLIIDHGDQYMTIYGNNQSLLKRAGDVVKAGDVVATTGNSGGNQQSGLYFEMRHQGRAFDPLDWVTIR